PARLRAVLQGLRGVVARGGCAPRPSCRSSSHPLSLSPGRSAQDASCPGDPARLCEPSGPRPSTPRSRLDWPKGSPPMNHRRNERFNPTDPQMSAADAFGLYELFEDNGIKVWLDGGWGVDALLGEQTREHA